MYYIILTLLLLFSLKELFSKKRYPIFFVMVYGLMTLMATFRYGQIHDFFAYGFLYKNPHIMEAKDPGFAVLMVLSQNIGIDYITFVAIMSFLCMVLAFPFFSKKCHYSFISLLIFYSYTFLEGAMGSFRQGLCLSLLLCIYPLLEKRKYIWFTVGVIAGCLIHLSFIVCLLFPFILKTQIHEKKYVSLILIFFLTFASLQIDYSVFLPSFLSNRVSVYLEKANSAGFLQLLLRFALIIPLLLIKTEKGTTLSHAKSIYFTGFCLYCLLGADVLTAGRIEYYFRTFLCLFIAELSITKNRWNPKIFFFFSFMIIINTFVWFKNIDFACENGNYNKDINAFNFPYISIFNHKDLYLYSNPPVQNMKYVEF